jgi:hypothetical protein
MPGIVGWFAAATVVVLFSLGALDKTHVEEGTL